MEDPSVVDWLAVMDLVGPMAGSVLAMVILVVPIVWGLLRFLGRSQVNDIRTARVLERLSVGQAGLPSLIGAEVATVLHHERNGGLSDDYADAKKREAMEREIEAASLISDADEADRVTAEIYKSYGEI